MSRKVEFLRVRPSAPENEFWEVLNGDLAQHLYESYPLAGITTQIMVRLDPNPELDEPGRHRSIVTIGEVSPIGGHSR